jgi:hypothetical protein
VQTSSCWHASLHLCAFLAPLSLIVDCPRYQISLTLGIDCNNKCFRLRRAAACVNVVPATTRSAQPRVIAFEPHCSPEARTSDRRRGDERAWRQSPTATQARTTPPAGPSKPAIEVWDEGITRCRPDRRAAADGSHDRSRRRPHARQSGPPANADRPASPPPEPLRDPLVEQPGQRTSIATTSMFTNIPRGQVMDRIRGARRKKP